MATSKAAEPQIREFPAQVQFARSQDEFRRLVLTIEGNETGTAPRTLDRVAQRMFVVFKEEEAIEKIASGRFRDGTPSYHAYKAEHATRKELLKKGLQARYVHCRELYSKKELLQYAGDRRHGNVVLDKDDLRNTFRNWRTALVEYPENYRVRLTEAPLPIKYSVRDGSMAMIHNGVQIETVGRLMGFLLAGHEVAGFFAADFNKVWDDAAAASPDNETVVRWIDDTLIPALEAGT